MKKSLLILLILTVFFSVSCFNESIVYPFDEKVKEYFDAPENQDYIEPESLQYEMHSEKYEIIGKEYISEYGEYIFYSTDKYIFGIKRSNILKDFDKEFFKYEPFIINLKQKGFYYDIFSALFQMNNKKSIHYDDIINGFPIPYNWCLYYDPYKDEYLSNVKIKDISENKVVLTFIVTESETPYTNFMLNTPIISFELFNEMKEKTKEAGFDVKRLGLDLFQEKTKDIILSIPDDLAERYDTALLPEKFYFTNIYNTFELDRTLYELGYTQKDIRFDKKKLGYKENLFQGIIIDITIELKNDELDISYVVVEKSP